MTILGQRREARRSAARFEQRPPLILLNGLAEQTETWFRNTAIWRRRFDVHQPRLLAFDGASLHRRIDAEQPIDIEYLLGRLRLYLDEFAPSPPYALVASSMGGKVAIEFAVRYPEQVSRLVLLAPSGLGGEERLPIVAGVRRGDVAGVVASVFFDRIEAGLVEHYRDRFANRRWRRGLLRAVRGTRSHSVRDLLPRVRQPTLLVVGREDRIIDVEQALSAAEMLPRCRLEVLAECGHAPQIEKAALVNRLVTEFLTAP